VVGAPLWDDGQPDEGGAFLYLGSAAGLSGTSDWTAEVDQDSAWLSHSVGTTGDVDGDGYDDVVVGAYKFDDGQLDEGAAFLYLGSAAGLSATPDWSAESDQQSAWFGDSVGTAGDVNGDGYDDVVVGAFGDDHGGGLSAAPDWTAEGDREAALFGFSVGTAGDVDADGFADVVVGASHYRILPGVDGGEALVFAGVTLGAEFGCHVEG
jgi:FG-GAP-like repeat/FG-GAP repeat